MNSRFSVEAAESGSAFVGFGDADLDLIFLLFIKSALYMLIIQ